MLTMLRHVAARRASYRPPHSPSFDDEFDIVEYRRWQTERQPLRMTPHQLLDCSVSTMATHEWDIELSIGSCRDADDDSRSDVSPAMDSVADPVAVDRIRDAIRRFASVHSLRLYFGSRCVHDGVATQPPTARVRFLTCAAIVSAVMSA
jgi:hypothetical protein